VLYIVELDMPHDDLLSEWHEWYSGHIRKLLTIPGFVSAQRFDALSDARSRYVTIYSIAGSEVITGEIYQTRAGPRSAAPWDARMTNWRRNLFEGIDHLAEVPLDSWVALLDRERNEAPKLNDAYVPLTPAGLDRSVVERGLHLGAPSEPPPPASAAAGASLRILRPITSLFRAQPA
jgi:hypothetical protein